MYKFVFIYLAKYEKKPSVHLYVVHRLVHSATYGVLAWLIKKVHRVLVDIVSAAANSTPGLGRYPPFKREV